MSHGYEPRLENHRAISDFDPLQLTWLFDYSRHDPGLSRSGGQYCSIDCVLN
jgi:hypothetical protein